MKLLAFVDVHTSVKALKRIKKKVKKEKPDLLLCAGDISIFEHGVDYILYSLNKLKKPILMIHGNHERDRFMRRVCKLFGNIIFVHKKHYKKDNLIVLGYGGGGFTLRDSEFKKTAKKFKKIIKKNEDKKIILLVHGPPYGTDVDKIVGQHCGNKDITDFIKKNKVDYVICGHLHENFGKKDKIKKTIVMNPGPYGKIIRL